MAVVHGAGEAGPTSRGRPAPPLGQAATTPGPTGFTQALGAEVRPHGVRTCLVYPGAMATHWGTWSAEGRSAEPGGTPPREALPPETVAAFIAWLATAPSHLVLGEAVVTPLDEQGYP